MKKILYFSVILLLVGLVFTTCIDGKSDVKLIESRTGKSNCRVVDFSVILIEIKSFLTNYNKDDCGCDNSNYNENYPPIICMTLFLLKVMIGVPGDLIGLFLIYIGFSREIIEKIFAPLINFYDFISLLWLELDCPPPVSNKI
jgi:hypothetical protein